MEDSTSKGFWGGVKKFFDLNPTLVRGVIVAVAAVLATFLGREFISDTQIEAVVQFFIAISALISALWTRNKVIAENKVIAWKPDPEGDIVAAGPATIEASNELQVDALAEAASHSLLQGEVRAELKELS